MLYKTIIVDDEIWAPVYLRKTVDFNSLGFEITEEIYNSTKALDFIVEHKPDVVITDIRMPKLSGLELIKKVRNLNINSEFIILSAYADFNYAKEAITLGAYEYCLKPINVQEAVITLKRLQEHLISKNDTLNPEDSLKGFEAMLMFIENNIHMKLQLKDLAKQFFFHPNYCCYLFKKYVGKSFSEYLTDLRMKLAVVLLNDTDISINEIANRVGIGDYFYFNKVFKKHYDKTPIEFRKTRSNYVK